MVMHARKLPRISDGFSEKHQAHGYETQAKYPGNKYRYNHEKGQRDSPSNSLRRSSSPESRSQSPRFHKNNYFKVREKERDREREREYKDYRDRTGVFMCEGSRSPKDRRREIRNRDRDRDRERDHRESRAGIHDRINSGHKKEEKERLMRVGEWSEHVSSSGKKYYYNCRSEVSQWEKPQEWLEWERSHPRSGHLAGANKEVTAHPLQRVHSEKGRPDKHSTLNDGYRESRELRECERNERDRREYRNDEHYTDRRDGRKYGQVPQSADMDISSGNSTPTSESHHGRLGGEGGQEGGGSHPTHNQFSRPMKVGPNNLMVSNNHCGPSSSQILSSVPHLLNSHPRLMGLGHANDQKNSNDDSEPHPMMMPHMSLSQGSTNNHGHPSLSVGHSGYTTTSSSVHSGLKSHLEPLSIIPNNNVGGAGPPTPTHSENQEGLDIRKGSPNSSLNSLHSLSVTVSNTPSLTPSLANYYDERLISHVSNWPADNIEKQCQRLSEEAHSVGSLLMTKVSADLKMARSLVRLSEIQATLHEQRILFLRAQKRELDEVKPQNCYINDS